MLQHLKAVLISVSILVLSFSTQALERTVSFPAYAPDATVESMGEAVIMSLINRGWIVDERKDPRILAHLYKRGIKADLVINYTDRLVTIKTTCFQMIMSTEPMTIGQETAVDYYPSGWIRNIQSDVVKNLPIISADMANTMAADDTAPVDVKSELEHLKELFEQGLITEDVYHQMQLKLLENKNAL